MKICPFCSADNRDEAVVCFYCGRDLSAPLPPHNTPGRTQPVNVQPRSLNSPPPPPSNTQPYSTQPMPPQGGYPPQDGYPPQPGYPYQPAQTQPANSPYPQDPHFGYAQPGYPPQQGYSTGYQPGYPPSAGYPQAAYPQPVIPPPPTPPVTDSGPSRAWKILALSLGAVLLFVCGLAAWTFTSAATGRATLFGSSFSTQVAQVISRPSAETPLESPTEMPSPTPWPTFTPQSAEAPAEQATPNPPAINVEKLLSPECSAALDRMTQLNDQLKKEPTAPLSQDWRSQFSQATADLKTHCGTLDSASPVPGVLKETQQKINQANTEFDQASQLFNEGVKELNPAKFVEAAQHAGEAGKNLSEAIAELKKIGQ